MNKGFIRVSVKDRLPKKEDVYFIITEGEHRTTAGWKNPHPRLEHGWLFDEKDCVLGKPNVTHWLEER